MTWAPEPLSAAGEQRCDALLGDLRAVVVRRGRVRRARQLAVGVAAVVLLGAGVWWSVGKTAPVVIERATETAGGDRNPVQPGRVVVEIVKPDPGIVDRYAASPPVDVERLDDEGLRAALAESGQDTGLVRIGSRLMRASELAMK